MIKIIAVGRIKEKAMNEVLNEYKKRLKPVHEIKIIELPNSKHSENEVGAILQDESSRILSNIESKDYVMLLELKGKNISSEELSEKMSDVLDYNKTLVFVIGGSHGVSDEVRARSDFMWQLSRLTFPHQFVRILLFEQIYRGFMIQKNHPYHK